MVRISVFLMAGLCLDVAGVLANPEISGVWASRQESAGFNGQDIRRQGGGALLYGLGGALGGGALGALAMEVHCRNFGEDCGFAWPVGAVFGGAIGYAMASPFGVYRGGVQSNRTGSLGAAMTGGLLAGALGAGSIKLLEERLPGDEKAWYFWSVALAPPVGAMIGFNATLRHPASPSSLSFVPMPGKGFSASAGWTLPGL